MSIRPVLKAYSDRGNLKDLVNKIDDPYETTTDYSPAELRTIELLDFAEKIMINN